MNFFEKKNNVWLFFGVLVACFTVSAGVRYQQCEIWKLTPAAYCVGERPMMTTLDAPYWLRFAREYNEGVFSMPEVIKIKFKGLLYRLKKILSSDHMKFFYAT